MTVGDHHRPRYHVLPAHGWMNDPNGLIQHGGQYHVFYQHNPHGSTWEAIHWGHASSTDLVHWRDEPIALAPTPGSPDADGCWSGCAVIDGEQPVLLYTGHRGGHETVCLARGGSDLRDWQKHDANPVLEPPSEGLSGFRDPKVWRADGHWFMVIGSGLIDGGGAILLFRSLDLLAWEYLGPAVLGDGTSRGQIWECPDLFALDGRHVMLFSPHPEPSSTRFMVGAWDGRTFSSLGGGLMDLGTYFYAAQTLTDGRDRRIAWGWIKEGRSGSAQQAAGWSGILSLPRLLSLTSSGSLSVEPVPELRRLRLAGKRVRDLHLPNGAPYELTADANHGYELAIRFLPAASARLRVSVCRAPGAEETTVLEVDPVAGTIAVDRRRSSLDADGDRDLETYLIWPTPPKAADLRLFIDGSVMELFAGSKCITTRVYPTSEASTGVELAAVGGDGVVVSASLWPMRPIEP